MKILLAEDDFASRKFMSKILDKYGDADITVNGLEAVDAFLMTSFTEGSPQVVKEAMACGCPIVTTDVGAIPEMLDINNGANYGICVKPKQVSELRDAIKVMLENKEYASSCGEKARLRVQNLYSMPIVWNKLCSIWKETSDKEL